MCRCACVCAPRACPGVAFLLVGVGLAFAPGPCCNSHPPLGCVCAPAGACVCLCVQGRVGTPGGGISGKDAPAEGNWVTQEFSTVKDRLDGIERRAEVGTRGCVNWNLCVKTLGPTCARCVSRVGGRKLCVCVRACVCVCECKCVLGGGRDAGGPCALVVILWAAKWLRACTDKADSALQHVSFGAQWSALGPGWRRMQARDAAPSGVAGVWMAVVCGIA